MSDIRRFLIKEAPTTAPRIADSPIRLAADAIQVVCVRTVLDKNPGGRPPKRKKNETPELPADAEVSSVSAIFILDTYENHMGSIVPDSVTEKNKSWSALKITLCRSFTHVWGKNNEHTQQKSLRVCEDERIFWIR